MTVDEIKEQLQNEIEAYLASHLVGRMSREEMLSQTVALYEARYRDTEWKVGRAFFSDDVTITIQLVPRDWPKEIIFNVKVEE